MNGHQPDSAVRSLLDLWRTTADGIADLDDADWTRPVDDGTRGTDVTALVTHLAGVHYAGPEHLREAIATARARAEARLTAAAPTSRVLGAQCLDMCLHTYDLTRAVGVPFDLDSCEPATLEACRVLVGFAPRLLVAAGAHDATVRLLVRPGPRRAPIVDHTLRIRGGRSDTGPTAAVPDGVHGNWVDVTAAGLLLLLTGRRDPDALATDGVAGWSGDAADRLVHRTRLAGATA